MNRDKGSTLGDRPCIQLENRRLRDWRIYGQAGPKVCGRKRHCKFDLHLSRLESEMQKEVKTEVESGTGPKGKLWKRSYTFTNCVRGQRF
jgi:hypothetical protein